MGILVPGVTAPRSTGSPFFPSCQRLSASDVSMIRVALLSFVKIAVIIALSLHVVLGSPFVTAARAQDPGFRTPRLAPRSAEIRHGKDDGPAIPRRWHRSAGESPHHRPIHVGFRRSVSPAGAYR